VYVFLAGDDEKINERIAERLEVRASADSRLKVDEENKWKFTETFDSLGRFSKHFVTKFQSKLQNPTLNYTYRIPSIEPCRSF
jgi:hypothetical protein